MEHVEQSLQYAIYELRLAFIELALILTEFLTEATSLHIRLF